MKLCLCRANRKPHQVGNLIVTIPFDVVQDEDRARLARELADRFFEIHDFFRRRLVARRGRLFKTPIDLYPCRTASLRP